MRTLLLTGASGFIGKAIKSKLTETYAISTLGRDYTCDIQCDLRYADPALEHRFDCVVHAAGKAHSVPSTQKDREMFWQVNLEGTKRLCRALERVGVPETMIFISSVSVYGVEYGSSIDENHDLAGTSDYARSKIEAEHFLTDWCKRQKTMLTILRPSLVVGPSAPGNFGAMVQGIAKGFYVLVGGGTARKSVFWLDDFASLIPKIEKKGGVYNLADNRHPSVAELSSTVALALGVRRPRNIPLILARVLALCGDFLFGRAPIDTARLQKLQQSLTFSNDRLHGAISFHPTDVLEGIRQVGIKQNPEDSVMTKGRK